MAGGRDLSGSNPKVTDFERLGELYDATVQQPIDHTFGKQPSKTSLHNHDIAKD